MLNIQKYQKEEIRTLIYVTSQSVHFLKTSKRSTKLICNGKISA
nr:MAG TPA: hypothetical protein [Caudoviricetes sp.]